jgi:hypothetical protein
LARAWTITVARRGRASRRIASRCP